MVFPPASIPNSDITPYMERLASSEAPVTLTRTIKGLAFNHPAHIVETTPEFVVLETEEIRLYAALEGRCHIHSPSLPGSLMAGLLDHDLSRHLIVLSGFSILAFDWRDRFQ